VNTMKVPCCSVFILFLSISCFGQVAPKTARLVNPIIKITKVLQKGSVSLQRVNSSEKPLKIWDDANSWGAMCWRVVRIRDGRAEAFFQNPHQIFTVNVPEFHEIAPGAHLKVMLDLNGGDWCGFGYCAPYSERGLGGTQVRFDLNDMIVVVYDVPSTDESYDKGVWNGVVAASATVK
jgi:hypothetical protein